VASVDKSDSFVKDLLESLDLRFVLWIQKHLTSPRMDILARFCHMVITDEGIAVMTPCVLLMFGARSGFFVLAAITISELVNGCAKWFVQRPRPFWQDSSSHAQQSASITTALLLQYNMSGFTCVLYCAVAALCALFRVYDGVHYLSCVLAGALLGVIVPLLLYTTNVLELFVDLPSFSYAQSSVTLAAVLVPLALLALIRRFRAAPPAEQFLLWQHMANKNTPSSASMPPRTLQTRRLSKYGMQLGSIFGGAIACMLSARGLERFELAFLEEDCHLADHQLLMFARLALGYTGLALTLVPFGFVLPAVLVRRDQRAAAAIVRFAAFAAGSIWIGFGAPSLAAERFGWECPVFTCDNVPRPQSWT
jgi:hypothetical protein